MFGLQREDVLYCTCYGTLRRSGDAFGVQCRTGTVLVSDPWEAFFFIISYFFFRAVDLFFFFFSYCAVR